ncbi:NifU family protein [Thermopolyspora sp. NPDC052614]|uniref:NifU family protein n=1 Tax=Thermopolyspora sp. NPDC052614 TaxID=3155682 RepID=UPI0034251A96
MFARVQEVIGEIRPYLQGEGGDVTLVDVADGVVSVRLTGACGGCSAAVGTVTNVIERRLKEALPEVSKVALVG